MENIKSAYNNNKFKISAPTWNNKFDLPDGSYSISDIRDYFEYIIKKHGTIADNPPIQIYVNKIKNHIVFDIKTGYKLELFSLLSEETMRSLGSTKRVFFSIWVFYHDHSRITGLQGKGEGISLTPNYHFHPPHRHLDISRAIAAESSPLHIASSWTRTGNLWFPSSSR